ncbi:lytic transglycosylase domain-containing protein [Acidithiobacillus concretivorus]|jgi:soluble lytic murein transglycosylase-like protein|uniref:lytic transglycosylase domain-containing protein n=1 Tax=Acidithiobacillus concretivorus TaxID=3063952 RepID=UPI001D01F161|nr:lytic transglycosylase domain-containing protein [Acidithiobacillus concretivorus]
MVIFHNSSFFHATPLRCIQQASQIYAVPRRDIIALMKNEGGAPGIAVKDSNGTQDLGPMQVNTCHLPFLRSYGYSYRVLKNNPCANVMAGTWVFARCLAITGNLFSAAACYNAGPGNLAAAWRDGYVQRFAGHLGLQVLGKGQPKQHYLAAGLVVEGGQH